MKGLLQTQSKEKGDGEMKIGVEHRGDLGSPSLPLPGSQPLPWVSAASGATSLAKGFPNRSEGPSPLQPSRFREITASLKKGHDPTSQPLGQRGQAPAQGDTADWTLHICKDLDKLLRVARRRTKIKESGALTHRSLEGQASGASF